MKTIEEYFAAINKAESDLSMAVLEVTLGIKVKDKRSECAKEIADMMLAKLNEISKLRKEIGNRYTF